MFYSKKELLMQSFFNTASSVSYFIILGIFINKTIYSFKCSPNTFYTFYYVIFASTTVYLMKKRLRFVFIIFLAVSLFGLYSCKKEDLLPPSVEIRYPQPNSQYSLGDSIPFKVIVKDDKRVKYVQVALYTQDNRSAGKLMTYYPEHNPAEITGEYYLSDTTLASGIYHLVFFAGDGTHNVRYPVNIRIAGISQIGLGIFAFTESASGFTELSYIDTAGRISLWQSFPYNFFNAHLDNTYQKLYIIPKTQGNLHSMSIPGKNIDWSIPSKPTLADQWFRGSALLNHRLYVGDYNAGVTIYDRSGRIVNSFELPSSYMGVRFLVNDPLTYVYSVPKSSAFPQRILVYNFGFNLIQNMVFPYDLAGWEAQSDGTVLLFYNTDEGFEIARMSYIYGSMDVLSRISGYTLYDVALFSNSVYLLGTDQGLFGFTVASQRIQSLLTGYSITDIDINPLSLRAVLCSGDKMLIYNVPLGETEHVYPFTGSLKEAFWHFNK